MKPLLKPPVLLASNINYIKSSEDTSPVHRVIMYPDLVVNSHGLPDINLPGQDMPPRKPLAIEAGGGPLQTPLQAQGDTGSGPGTCTQKSRLRLLLNLGN